VLAGNLRPDSAKIRFEGREVNIREPSDADDLGIRVVYQNLALCDNLDVVDNLLLGQEIAGSPLFAGRVKRFSEEARAREVLDRVNLENIELDRPVRNLSGGQRQNIAIARTLLYDPELVILDEPTSALSVNAVRDVSDLVQKLAAEKIGVIVVSHDIHKFVIDVADRLVVLRLGRNVADFQTGEATAEQVVNAMVGSEDTGASHHE
jgi:simple sugar transport system ATP-binding protein/D-xylose transport system ATP-binding protein